MNNDDDQFDLPSSTTPYVCDCGERITNMQWECIDCELKLHGTWADAQRAVAEVERILKDTKP